MKPMQTTIEETLLHDILEPLKDYLSIDSVYYLPQSELSRNTALLVIKGLEDTLLAYPAPTFQGDRHQFLQQVVEAMAPKNRPLPLTEKEQELIARMNTVPDKKLSTYYQRERSMALIAKTEETLDRVLSQIALPARSDKHNRGFTETAKLDAIKEMLSLENSPYSIIGTSKNCVIYGQEPPQRGEQPILVSSHADIVSQITKVFSEKGEEYYRGTYDNLGTNAAACVLMLNETFPKNVYFAFTADEETGRCHGAKDALSFLADASGVNPLCIALDVTWDGFGEKLYSIENFATSMEPTLTALAQRTDSAHATANFTRVGGYDEGTYYCNKKMQACSICLPCSGSMHSDSGVDIFKATFHGYILSLAAVLHTLTEDKTLIADYVTAKEVLFEQMVAVREKYAKERRGAAHSWALETADEYMDDVLDSILAEIMEIAEDFPPNPGGYADFMEQIFGWYLPNLGIDCEITEQQAYACFCVAHDLEILEEDEFEY